MNSRTMKKKYGLKLPYRCECGGVLDFDYDFGRVWSACKKCSPVQKIDVNEIRRKIAARLNQRA